MDYQIVTAYAVAIIIHLGLMFAAAWAVYFALDNTLGRYLDWRRNNAMMRTRLRETDAQMHERLKKYAAE